MKILCPICGEALQLNESGARCTNGHCFDYGKGGYLNLALKQSKGHGDEKEMVRARTEFLNTDGYGFLRTKLVERIQELHPSSLIDLGCGEGYYTAKFPCENKLGFDLSKTAIQYAARHDPSTRYIVASTSRLPLPDKCADLAVICFAPVFSKEIARVLKDNGKLMVVTPGKRHLWQMKEVLYETPYENPIEDADYPLLEKCDEVMTRNDFTVNQKHLQDLFMMTPYYHRTSVASKEKLAAVSELTITAEFIIRTYRKADF